MKKKQVLLLMSVGILLVINACTEPDDPLIQDSLIITENSTPNNDDTESTTNQEQEVANISYDFMVTIENVVTPKPIFQSGIFAVPVGGSGPAPLFPGEVYEFEIDAGPHVLPGDGGPRLSFVTMFVQSNDLFFAPNEEGIALYNEDGTPICGDGPLDVTDQVLLWDAGTEINEPTGGPNQKPQQAPDVQDQGEDENGVVTEITNNSCSFGNVLPENNEVIKVTIEYIGPAKFKVRIKNVSDGMTIATPGKEEGSTAAVPISPGVYAVHTMPAPFFVSGAPASGAGLIASPEGVEDIAEDGFIDNLLMDTKAATGLTVPLSPGIWATHMEGIQPIYEIDMPDFGEGLEAIAEDGIPVMLAEALAVKEGIYSSGAFDTPVGADGPGAIGPGGSYQFSFTAEEGQNLSLVTMFVQSNDWFYSFISDGLPLFIEGEPMYGDVTEYVFLYDVGTEADEYAGAGLSQVIRQSGADSGAQDPNSNVRLIDPIELPNIPDNANVIKISIEANSN
ncbi:MAG: hypothetical protein HKN31_02740 [Pricia sp.]|nr:hypothetical protein [Pricia sp.]